MRSSWIWCVLAVLALVVGGCGGDVVVDSGDGGDDGPAATATADPMATPKGSIEHQLALLNAGDVDALRACFTPRQQKRITAEAVAEGAKEVGGMSIDELFASMTEGEYEGKKTAKVKMQNGRTLTTLVLTDGKWISDTVWFR